MGSTGSVYGCGVLSDQVSGDKSVQHIADDDATDGPRHCLFVEPPPARVQPRGNGCWRLSIFTSERLHEDVSERMKSSSELLLSKINPAERNRPILPYQNTKMIPQKI